MGRLQLHPRWPLRGCQGWPIRLQDFTQSRFHRVHLLLLIVLHFLRLLICIYFDRCLGILEEGDDRLSLCGCELLPLSPLQLHSHLTLTWNLLLFLLLQHFLAGIPSPINHICDDILRELGSLGSTFLVDVAYQRLTSLDVGINEVGLPRFRLVSLSLHFEFKQIN